MAQQNIEVPQLPIPGEDNSNRVPEQVVIGHPAAGVPPIPQQKSGMDLYFDQALDYMGDHPVLTGVGGFFALYFAAGAYKSVSKRLGGSSQGVKYLKGGFDPKMNAKEALAILNLNETNLSKKKLKEVHRRIMLANHPDKGGSPYLATKINEAKDFLEKKVVRK
ncbi:Pam18 [Kluyveromyces lactis]|uniref:Mitochondrial import inner membrane translocase subunit TIM14 n=1 Tax=Kluyveromyces lactis (strain ATCC 8585 / CBS 2359 / DSM 70799 / NBRC 1267 / NRRL Y-1140 / WM37) TaxID=284590 RepID=TIM14_KLULA|nr:uncharacterized protein KLLA0_E09461g [Kluyveromyces lactis]Q6CNW2.1 RecName: Full=Mitochondrial import inner membrane translocase subunit TIM14; AltName: Full=Presequence translocated-associated motor subunit PAM18 [Kluyveromyces lactis NRRL Y-1140]QEU62704.1 Pam18 [Kluyveromyces lactis]CAG99464.1 KLLA0E09461p [Kluyveromyces lactis]|eukprot:XP_454377.1 uncharacterized protein KLLA0_E09461g [Kluyveromyces lactis]